MKLNLKSILNPTIWKVGLRIILGAFALAALIFTVALAGALYRDAHGRIEWRDVEISKNVEVRAFRDGVRVWNTKTGKYTTPKLRWVSCNTTENDSLNVICDKAGNRGYINCNTGEIVIRPEIAKLKCAWNFSEGVGVAVLPEEDSLSILDQKGQIISKNIAPLDRRYDYVFHDGLCQMHVGDHFGLVAKDGTWRVPPVYHTIWDPNVGFGYRMAINEEGYWLYDPDLKLVFDTPQEKLEFAVGRSEGEGTLYRTRKVGDTHIKELLNYDLNVVEPFVIDGTEDLMYLVRYNEDDANEYALDPDLCVYSINEWKGLLDKRTGSIVVPATYTGFEMLSKNLIKANLSLHYDENAVILDRKGHVIKQ